MADNKDLINCPACGKQMKKVFMPKQGINLDVCVDGCGGIYFDNREFSKFDEPHEDISPLTEILKDKQFEKVDESLIRKCPVCHSDMVKNYSSSNNSIQVDECYTCGGKFLDFNELEKIREGFSTEGARSSDVLKKLYSDIGTDIIIPEIRLQKSSECSKKWTIIGVVIGFIVSALIFCLNSSAFLYSYDDLPLISLIAIAVSIVLICAGLGSLIGKSLDNSK